MNNSLMEEQKINALWTPVHWLSLPSPTGSYTAAAVRFSAGTAAINPLKIWVNI